MSENKENKRDEKVNRISVSRPSNLFIEVVQSKENKKAIWVGLSKRGMDDKEGNATYQNITLWENDLVHLQSKIPEILLEIEALKSDLKGAVPETNVNAPVSGTRQEVKV
ncbi:MAG: hypothetical protein DRN71_04850 [Candidatus Nanohalarchaeota archaeon]|nr:MAG: hypothetical protein DRN71_04850 [Candidatus Nanohaloarchaeota archaeon]